MTNPLPSPELLRKLLRYDPETGKLFWRCRPVELFTDGRHSAGRVCARWNTRYAGREAFTALDSFGYRVGAILNRRVSAHRVIWAMVHGVWPADVMDHIDGDPDNNILNNLKSTTQSVNMRNRKRPSDNTSGAVGVDWHKPKVAWRARIRDNGRNIHLGYFSDKADAITVRKAAEVKYGYSPTHGR